MKKFFCLFIGLLSIISVSAENIDFTMEVSNVDVTSFHITVTPSIEDTYYIAYFVTLDEWNSGVITVSSLQDEIYAECDTYEKLVENLEHGYVSCDVIFLMPNTEYVIYTCAVNEYTRQIKSDIDTIRVKTLEGVISDNAFSLSFDGKLLNIDCTNDDRYFIVIESEEDYVLFAQNFEQESLQAEIRDLYLSWVNGNCVAERDRLFVYYGDQSINVRELYRESYGITPYGKYVVLVAGAVDDYINTEVAYLQIYLDEENNDQAIDVVENNKKLTKRFENNSIVIYQDNDTKYNILGNKIK